VNAARGFYTTDVYAEHYLGIRWPRRVWAAVIAQAIKDIVEGPAAWELKGYLPEDAAALCADIRAAAERWVADDANEPRRFVWVCEQLGLEVSAVRRSITRRRAA
jgi:hypothetical protein